MNALGSGELPPELFVQALTQTPVGMALLDPQGLVVFVNPAFERLTGRAACDLLGRSPLEAVHPEDREGLKGWLENPGAPRSRTPARWISPAGQVCESECLPIAVFSRGQAFTMLTALDVTPSRKLAYRIQSLARFASALALATTLGEALNVLARSVVEATSARACAVLVLGRPVVSGQGAPSIRTVGTANLPPGWARLVEALWRTGEPLPPRDALATGRTVLADTLPDAIRAYAEDAGVGAVASVPMRSQGRIVGLLNCIYPVAAEIDEAELAFLETVAPLAGVVVENARLYEEVRERVSLQERQHLARELHDSVSQALYGIGLGARTARKLLDQDPPRAAEPLDYVLGLTESALREMRALLFDLRPESLQRDGLVAALQARVRAFTSLQVDLDLPEEPDLPLEVKHGLFRIASEAAHNVVKHANATHLRLSLRLEEGAAVLEVHDDGQGFAIGEGASGHMGLASMRERAEALGGTLLVDSRPGGGARVVARVPMG